VSGAGGGEHRSGFTPAGADFAARAHASFERQRFMAALGCRLARVEPGEAEVEVPCRDDLTQQHGYVHAGVVATIADTACGIAALTLMPAGAAVLSVEFKLNLLAPAAGERLLARGRVLRPGRTLTVCTGEVVALEGERETLVASMLATMMAVRGRPGLAG
jgi:uncharacterized protein (TIGR00369 family)